MSRKALIYISIILTVFLGISLYYQYKANEEKSLQRQAFVNSVYNGLHETIFLISEMDESDSEGEKEKFELIVKKLEGLDMIMTAANAFLDRDIYYGSITDSFGNISRIISGGQSARHGRICDGFLEDGKISRNELNFLLSLKADLEQIKSYMSISETGQVNSNITIHEINNLFRRFFSKYNEIQKISN